MSAWEDKFTFLIDGPVQDGARKCENAERAIRNAIAMHEMLAGMDIHTAAAQHVAVLMLFTPKSICSPVGLSAFLVFESLPFPREQDRNLNSPA